MKPIPHHIANKALKSIVQFIPKHQYRTLENKIHPHTEEHQYFRNMLIDLAKHISDMPKTYEQDGKGDDALVYLHYFGGSIDSYITEKDIDSDGEGQIQAFGFQDLGYGGELGYISIEEICDTRMELDLHWQITTIGEIKKKHGEC